MVEHFRGFFVVGVWFRADLGQELPVFCIEMALNWPLIALSTNAFYLVRNQVDCMVANHLRKKEPADVCLKLSRSKRTG